MNVTYIHTHPLHWAVLAPLPISNEPQDSKEEEEEPSFVTFKPPGQENGRRQNLSREEQKWTAVDRSVPDSQRAKWPSQQETIVSPRGTSGSAWRLFLVVTARGRSAWSPGRLVNTPLWAEQLPQPRCIRAPNGAFAKEH